MNSPQKYRIWKDTVMSAALTVLASMSLSGSVFAQNHNYNENTLNHAHRGWAYQHKEKGGRESYVMGVCVGQVLAQRGVTLPMPEPGKPPALDSSQEEAVESAVETCRASMTGKPMQSPTPAPTAAPTAVPPTAPIATPAPSASSSANAPASSPSASAAPEPAVTVTESPSAPTS